MVYKTKFVLKVLFENDGQLYNANRGERNIKKENKKKSLTYCRYHKLKRSSDGKSRSGGPPESHQGGSGALIGIRGGAAGGLGGIMGPLWKPNGGGRGGAP